MKNIKEELEINHNANMCKFLGILPKYTDGNSLLTETEYCEKPMREIDRAMYWRRIFPDLSSSHNFVLLLNKYLQLCGEIKFGQWNVEDDIENYFLEISIDNKVPRNTKLFLGVSISECMYKSIKYYHDTVGPNILSSIKDIEWEYN